MAQDMAVQLVSLTARPPQPERCFQGACNGIAGAGQASVLLHRCVPDCLVLGARVLCCSTCHCWAVAAARSDRLWKRMAFQQLYDVDWSVLGCMCSCCCRTAVAEKERHGVGGFPSCSGGVLPVTNFLRSFDGLLRAIYCILPCGA